MVALAPETGPWPRGGGKAVPQPTCAAWKWQVPARWVWEQSPWSGPATVERTAASERQQSALSSAFPRKDERVQPHAWVFPRSLEQWRWHREN